MIIPSKTNQIEMERDTLVRLENVELTLDSDVILRDATFSLLSGEFVYVIGRVGSGKSSLLRALYAELPVAGGQASIMGYDLHGISLRDTAGLRRRLGIVFQDFQLLTDRTVRCNLEFVLRATGWIDASPRHSAKPESPTKPNVCLTNSPAANSNAWPSPAPYSTCPPSS